MKHSDHRDPMTNQPLHLRLSKRESQIMDAVYRLGEASVADVVDQLPDQPTYNTVRVTMTNLEKKGYLKHRQVEQRYLYSPVVTPERAKRSAVTHLLQTFFEGSSAKAVLALLGMSSEELTQKEVDEIAALLEQARKNR